MPQKHDIGQQKRSRTPRRRPTPPDGGYLARALVEKGLAAHIILDTHMKHKKEH